MCVGGGGRSYPQPQRPEFEDSPPVVTGSQTGVENPKDTKKATEELKIRRQKKKELTLTLTLQQLKKDYQEVEEVLEQRKKVKEVLDSDQESLEDQGHHQKLKRWLLPEKL